MSILVDLFLFFAFVGGVVGIVALWTQHDINKARESEDSSKSGPDRPAA